jgi:hypothetical protein
MLLAVTSVWVRKLLVSECTSVSLHQAQDLCQHMFYTQQFLINLCLIKHHAMKMYVGAEIQLDSFSTLALDRNEWSPLGSCRFTH